MNSGMAASPLGTWESTVTHTTASKEPSDNGNRSASPSRNSIRSPTPASLASSRATASSAGLGSSPTATPRLPTRLAISRVTAPLPQPTSRTRSPAAIASKSRYALRAAISSAALARRSRRAARSRARSASTVAVSRHKLSWPYSVTSSSLAPQSQSERIRQPFRAPSEHRSLIPVRPRYPLVARQQGDARSVPARSTAERHGPAGARESLGSSYRDRVSARRSANRRRGRCEICVRR